MKTIRAPGSNISAMTASPPVLVAEASPIAGASLGWTSSWIGFPIVAMLAAAGTWWRAKRPPAAIGGFAAAGALLLALACVAENIEHVAAPHASAHALGGSKGFKLETVSVRARENSA